MWVTVVWGLIESADESRPLDQMRAWMRIPGSCSSPWSGVLVCGQEEEFPGFGVREKRVMVMMLQLLLLPVFQVETTAGRVTLLQLRRTLAVGTA